MKKPATSKRVDELAPVRAGDKRNVRSWTDRLVLFLRVMATVSMLKGLYHWALVCGFGAEPYGGVELPTPPWQSATAFFFVIVLVAGAVFGVPPAPGRDVLCTALASSWV